MAVMGDASQIENFIKLVDERDHPVVVSHHKQPIVGFRTNSPR